MKSPVDLKFIILAQITGCCLVILGHSFPFVTLYPPPPLFNKFIQFLYAFHMPLFVWCSGFLFAYTCQTERKSLSAYTWQRTIKLLTPYFVLSFIGLVPKILAAPVLNDTLQMDTLQVIRAFFVPREGVWGHFWFLPMIYLVGIGGYLLDKIINKNTWGWLLITLGAFAMSFYKADVLQWFALNDVLQFFVYFSLGVTCCRMPKVIFRRKFMGLLVGVGIFFSIALFISIQMGATLMHIRNTLIACCMIMAIVYICRLAEAKCCFSRQSSLAQTYQIFILSWPCQLVVGIVVERILHLSWMIFIPVVFVSGVLAPLLILRLVDCIENKYKTKILSFILGR